MPEPSTRRIPRPAPKTSTAAKSPAPLPHLLFRGSRIPLQKNHSIPTAIAPLQNLPQPQQSTRPPLTPNQSSLICVGSLRQRESRAYFACSTETHRPAQTLSLLGTGTSVVEMSRCVLHSRSSTNLSVAMGLRQSLRFSTANEQSSPPYPESPSSRDSAFSSLLRSSRGLPPPERSFSRARCISAP